jgi:hypothetical protein
VLLNSLACLHPPRPRWRIRAYNIYVNRRTLLGGAAGIALTDGSAQAAAIPIIDTHIHLFDRPTLHDIVGARGWEVAVKEGAALGCLLSTQPDLEIVTRGVVCLMLREIEGFAE